MILFNLELIREQHLFLTSLLQSHHGGLFDEVALDEAAEVLAVHAQVGQLECVDGHLQGELLPGTIPRNLQSGQRHDGRAGMGDTPRQTLLWKRERETFILNQIHKVLDKEKH